MGKSTIALDWSKNPGPSDRKRFTSDVMIINLKSEQWWKRGPKDEVTNIDYTKNMLKGIYIVDKEFCRQNIKISTNNKSNTLITQKYLYMMLNRSIENNCFIQLPDIKEKYQAYLDFKKLPNEKTLI